MTDLNIESHPCCASCLQDEKSIGGYQQSFGRMLKGHPYEYDWTCTCKGFKFWGKCKHVTQAHEEHCGWNAFFDGGEVSDGKCPNCGAETTAMNHAV